MEGWGDGRIDGWKDGGMEGWRGGRVGGWWDGGMEGCMSLQRLPHNGVKARDWVLVLGGERQQQRAGDQVRNKNH